VLTDLPLEALRDYRPQTAEPDGFDDFWRQTLDEARGHDRAPRLTPVTDTRLTTVDVQDVRFPGWHGEPVAGWLLTPRGAREPLPLVVQYLGYSGGRGLPTERLLFSAAGYAHLVVDSRGQGHDTPDRGEGDGAQWVEGLMTRGIEDPRHHYYRRLITDCVRAVDAGRALPGVDPDRVVLTGTSQGGGLTLAVAALAREAVAAALVDVPFLCHYRRAAQIAAAGPYVELVDYLRLHRPDGVEQAFATLAHFDGVHFAARATAPALFSVGLMDPVCPPSTVYAAYHSYAGQDKQMRVWEFGDHGGGYASQAREQLDWLTDRGLAPQS
jgi:cephalosporin-C deacetylase